MQWFVLLFGLLIAAIGFGAHATPSRFKAVKGCE
jgi:hypothetical protein